MRNVSLWIEITIAGAIYLLAAVLWLLALLGQTDGDLRELANSLAEYMPYLSIA